MERFSSLVVVAVGAAAAGCVVERGGGEQPSAWTGTWMPTLTWMLCCLAAACRPWTKGDSDSGLASERDSCGDEAM